MFSRTAPTLLRLTGRSSLRTPPTIRPIRPVSAVLRSSRRSITSTTIRAKGLQPDSEDPQPPKGSSVAGAGSHVTEPTPLTPEEYYEYSEHYFNVLLGELERAQEEGSDVEAEYSAGVLNVTVPAIGTYVLNKQPPNRQIWLSSPISGPKRYDWIVEGDRMHEKQETREFAHGQWVYLRDGSNLTDLLNSELSLSLPRDLYGEKTE